MDGRLGDEEEEDPWPRLVPHQAGAAGPGARPGAGHQLLHRQLRPQGQRPGRQVRSRGYHDDDGDAFLCFSLSDEAAPVIPGRSGDRGLAASSEQTQAAESLGSDQWQTLVQRTELGAG